MSVASPSRGPLVPPLRLAGVGLSIAGRRLLSDIDLTVARGRRLVILGPNGAGKSLLLRVCMGLIAPTEGRVVLAGGPVRPGRHALVFQRPVMLRRSVAGNIAYPLKLHRVPDAERRVEAALDRFGLRPLARQPARALSGGEQQRLALARAWVMSPELMLLDEPCAALDPSASRQVEAILRSFSDEGMTIVVTTHDLAQARRLADDVAFLDRGRLGEHGAAADFFPTPRTPEARAFLNGELTW